MCQRQGPLLTARSQGAEEMVAAGAGEASVSSPLLYSTTLLALSLATHRSPEASKAIP